MPLLNKMTVPELVQLICDIRMSAYKHAMATKDDRVHDLATEIQEIVNKKIREERPKKKERQPIYQHAEMCACPQCQREMNAGPDEGDGYEYK